MLYRPGSSLVIWGEAVDTLIVDDAEAETAAADQGWRRSPLPDPHPLDRDGDGNIGGSLPKRRRRET
jgi:hypothetical protein